MARWVRFEQAARIGLGTLVDDLVAVHEGDMFADARPTGERLALAGVRLLAPCVPGKFLALWNNFHAAAARQGNAIPTEPLYFLKAPSSHLGPGGAIRVPHGYTGKVIYEGELGIVIGREAHALDETRAATAIFGYTCVNDVTAIDLLNADPTFAQWTRAKGCDTFGVFGPAIATGLDPSTLTVRTRVNGRERQNYPASDMILSPARIVSMISREMTLMPGDLIACGTSIGAGMMKPNSVVEVEIDGIGVLSNAFAPQGASA